MKLASLLFILTCVSSHNLAWQMTGNLEGIVHNREWVGHSDVEGYTQLAVQGRLGLQQQVSAHQLTLGGRLQLPLAGKAAFRPWISVESNQYNVKLALGSLTPLSLDAGVYDLARNWPSWQASQQPIWHEGLQLGSHWQQGQWHAQVLWRQTESSQRAEYFDVLQQVEQALSKRLSLTFEHHIGHQGGQLTRSTESLRSQTLSLASDYQFNTFLQTELRAFASEKNSEPWHLAWAFSSRATMGKHTLSFRYFNGTDYNAVGASELYQLNEFSEVSWHWQIDPNMSLATGVQLTDRLFLSTQLLYWQINW